MKIECFTAKEWATYSENAHLIAFNTKRESGTDRIDFALMAVSDVGTPMGYITCYEHDAESLYWQFGGTFPGTKDTVLSYSCVLTAIRWCKEEGYKRISALVDNRNSPMLKMASKLGFVIEGVRSRNGVVLLEHTLELA